MKELRFALKQTIPILLTYLFIGIAFGMMMSDAGYSPLVSVLSAVLIYAGSMQIVMVSLLQTGAGLLTIALMTLFINGRHLFYGVGMIERFRGMGWRSPYMIFALTDETYSILCSVQYPEGLDRKKCDFLIAAVNHCYWILGCLAGACMGKLLPFDMKGIDFSATAFFLVVVLDQLRTFPSRIPALTGLISALVFLIFFGPEYFLIPALSVSMITLVVLRDRVSREMEGRHGS